MSRHKMWTETCRASSNSLKTLTLTCSSDVILLKAVRSVIFCRNVCCWCSWAAIAQPHCLTWINAHISPVNTDNRWGYPHSDDLPTVHFHVSASAPLLSNWLQCGEQWKSKTTYKVCVTLVTFFQGGFARVGNKNLPLLVSKKLIKIGEESYSILT